MSYIQNEAMSDIDKYLDNFSISGKLFRESVVFRKTDKGLCGTLIYPIKKLISIENYDLSHSFDNNDFKIENNKIYYQGSDDIPFLTEDEYWGKDGDPFDLAEMKKFHVKCPYYSESFLVKKQLLVTYEFEPQEDLFKPFKTNNLKNIKNKIKNKEDISIVVYGDSIARGMTSSKYLNRKPFVPPFYELIGEYLSNQGCHVEITNNSVIGMDSKWGIDNFDNNVPLGKDLYIICFGMNDGTGGVEEQEYISNINKMITKIGDKDIILISTIIPNPDAVNDSNVYFLNKQEKYLPYLLKLEKENVAICDMTSFHIKLLKIKPYVDISGNNINHPNDFLGRCIAKAILTMIER